MRSQRRPEAGLVYGECRVVDECSRALGMLPARPFDLRRTIERGEFLPQQAVFWRRSVVERVGLFDESLHYAMDFDFFIRAGRAFKVHYLPEPVAAFRMQSGSKTVSQAERHWREALAVSERHGLRPLNPWFWIRRARHWGLRMLHALYSNGCESAWAAPRTRTSTQDGVRMAAPERSLTNRPVYVDVSAAVHRRAGLGRYAGSLAAALAPLLPGELALFYNAEQGVEPLPTLPQVPVRTVRLGYKPWRSLVLAGGYARLPFNRLVPGASLFHATEHLLLPLRNVPTVLTVHDLIFRHLPEHHKALNRWYLAAAMPLFCRRATHIIAVSEATRRDLSDAYHVPAGKVTVIPEAAADHFRVAGHDEQLRVRSAHALPERFMLYVGTIEPRKNLITLFEAWAAARPAGMKLVIAGKKGWLYDETFARLEQLGIAGDVLFTGYVADDDLPALYSAAEAFLFPSVYEGFGLPILEAMGCGLPVACSDASSLPEVAGDAALLLPSQDVPAWSAAITRLAGEPGLRAELRTRGLAQSARFTWRAAAETTCALYREVMARAAGERRR